MQSFVLDFAEEAVPRVTTTTKSREKDLPLGRYGTHTLCVSVFRMEGSQKVLWAV